MKLNGVDGKTARFGIVDEFQMAGFLAKHHHCAAMGRRVGVDVMTLMVRVFVSMILMGATAQ